MLLYPLRSKSPRTLILIGALLWLPSVPLSLAFSKFLAGARDAAARVEDARKQGRDAPASGQELARAWEGIRGSFEPAAAEKAEAIRAYREGSYLQLARRRAPEAFAVQTTFFGASLGWTVGGRMLIGMALMKLGIFSAMRSRRFYARMALAGYGLGYPAVAYGAYGLVRHNFDTVYLFGGGLEWNAAGSIFVALGHAGALLWIYKAGWLEWLMRRLAAAGRMALTNYLTQSLVCTTLFYGYGFGLYATLDRIQLFGVVAAIWVLQLWYNPLWLKRFRFGPAEWLWRSLTYGRAQTMRAAA